jgi:cytochrome c oxidase cbb3-type subunit 3
VAEERKEIDPVTGTATTGHEWDGLRELNTPLPRWWLWLFYATIVWSVGYWIVYPSWPLVSGATEGILGWNTRSAVVADLERLQQQRGPMVASLASASLAEIVNDPKLLDFARAQGRVAFADNCAPCHGAGGGGAKGYPNLNDDDWLWGGTLQQIEQTIVHGVRSGDEKARIGDMPAFGRDGILKADQISAVVSYVRSLSGLANGPGADLALGKKVFAENCVTCHGEEGKGNKEVGSANLTDGIWLYGSDPETIRQTVFNGRGSVMPAWSGRLDEPTIKALTVYVHTFGGGEK